MGSLLFPQGRRLPNAGVYLGPPRFVDHPGPWAGRKAARRVGPLMAEEGEALTWPQTPAPHRTSSTNAAAVPAPGRVRLAARARPRGAKELS